jgi:predicted RNA-binding protein YlqC (UPF0109 family)
MSIAEAGTELQQFLQETVERIVEQPDQVRIVLGRRNDCVMLDVSVAENDRGRVLGRNGQTVRSLRIILASMALRRGIRCELSVPANGDGGKAL